MRVSNTYSEVMFTPAAMRRVIGHLSTIMPKLMCEYEFDTIAVTGKSGTALAFALAMHVDGLHVVTVRKGESSHGDMVEGPCGHSFDRYAFFDDFVASGSTRDRVHTELGNKARSMAATPPVLALTIEYSGGESVEETLYPDAHRSAWDEYKQHSCYPLVTVAHHAALRPVQYKAVHFAQGAEGRLPDPYMQEISRTASLPYGV